MENASYTNIHDIGVNKKGKYQMNFLRKEECQALKRNAYESHVFN